MNDFTKEELEYMSDILKIHINEYPTLTSRDQDFLEKLKSMIDNYCEHDTGECIGGSIQCHKCGEIWQ